MAIVVVGNVFVDIKGFPENTYVPDGRNAGEVEFVHGGVGRNVAEDIANVELRPRFVSMVDDTAEGEDVLRKLHNHKVDTRYVVSVPGGMGIWLAVFDNSGDLAGSISRRPRMEAMVELLDEKGIALSWDESLVDTLVKKAYSVTYGARNLRRVIQKQIEDELAQRIVDSRGRDVKHIRLSAADGRVNIEIE